MKIYKLLGSFIPEYNKSCQEKITNELLDISNSQLINI